MSECSLRFGLLFSRMAEQNAYSPGLMHSHSTMEIDMVALARSALIVSVLAYALPSMAHDAPAGWQYDMQCCQNRDCRPISSSWVKEGPDGYVITIDNEIVPYRDARIRNSPDGMYHWCTVDGRDNGRTICLYVPPRDY